MTVLSPGTIKKDIKSSKIQKILISSKQIWVIPENLYSVTDIIEDTYKTLTNLYPNQTIKKEKSNPTIIKISGTKNGRISISADGRTQFSHIYFKDSVVKSSVEDRQVKKIDDILFKLYLSAGPTTFKIGGEIYTISNYNQNTVKQVGSSGDKTDVVISTNTGNVYISLKGDTHQQWGGTSDFADDISVKTFVQKLKQIKQQNPNDKKEYYMDISDDLIKKSMYGKEFNESGSSSSNNVDHILVGERITMSMDNTITANKTYNKGFICSPRPTILSRNTGPSDKNRSDFGIQNTRIIIWPGVRSNAQEIK